MGDGHGLSHPEWRVCVVGCFPDGVRQGARGVWKRDVGLALVSFADERLGMR